MITELLTVGTSGEKAKFKEAKLPLSLEKKKEDLRNYRPVNLTSVLGKALQQSIIELHVYKHLQKNAVINES